MFIHVINADFTELDQVELWINIIHNTVDPENTYDPFLGLRLDKIHRYKYIQLNEINTWFMSFIEDEKNKLNIIYIGYLYEEEREQVLGKWLKSQYNNITILQK